MTVIGSHGTSYIFNIPRGDGKSRGNEPMRMQKSTLSMHQIGAPPSICLAYQWLKLIISMAFRAPQVVRSTQLKLSVRLGLSAEIFEVARAMRLSGRLASDLRLCVLRLISKACRGPIGKLALFNRFIAARIVPKINLTRSRDFLLRVQ